MSLSDLGELLKQVTTHWSYSYISTWNWGPQAMCCPRWTGKSVQDQWKNSLENLQSFGTLQSGHQEWSVTCFTIDATIWSSWVVFSLRCSWTTQEHCWEWPAVCLLCLLQTTRLLRCCGNSSNCCFELCQLNWATHNFNVSTYQHCDDAAESWLSYSVPS